MIIIICGFSAAGKDTLARELENKGFHFVVSHTSRPKRDYEKEKDPYYFITSDEFLKLLDKDEFLEVRSYHTLVNGKSDTWYYGVHKDEIKKDTHSVVVLDVIGLREFQKLFPKDTLSIFLSASFEERKQRCIERGDYDQTEFNRRYQDDLEKFPKEVILNEIDKVIESSNVVDDVNKILNIIKEKTNGSN